MDYSTAHRLAQEIRQSEEYQTYHGMKDSVLADETTAALIREYKKLQVKLQMGAVAGTKPDDDDMQRFQGITSLLFANPTVSKYMLAEMRLQQALADGGADNGVYVCVKMSWIDNNGNAGGRTFIFSEELVKDYAADWTGNEFRLTVTGMDNVSELSLTAQVMYDVDGGNDVVISGTTLTEKG